MNWPFYCKALGAVGLMKVDEEQKFHQLALIGAIFCVLILATSAQAQTRHAAVLQFSGPASTEVRNAVAEQAEDFVRLEPLNKVTTAAKRLRANLNTSTGKGKVATKLGLDFVIYGRVVQQGNTLIAKLAIAGPDGEDLTSRDVKDPQTARGQIEVRSATQDMLVAAIRTVGANVSEGSQSPEDNTEEVFVFEDWPDETSTKPDSKPAASGTTKPSETSSKPTETGKTGASKTPTEASVENVEPPKPRIASFFIGPGLGIRKTAIMAGGTPKSYNSGPYFSLGWLVDVRPLARSKKEKARGLALNFDGDVGLGIKSQIASSDNILNVLPVNMAFNAGYLYPIKKLQIGALIGATWNQLNIDGNPLLPSSKYISLRAGPSLIYTFKPESIALFIDGGVRLPFTLGSVAERYGENATGLGFDAGGGIGGNFRSGFSYRVRVSYWRMNIKFKGDFQTLEGEDETDQSITSQLLAGWSF